MATNAITSDQVMSLVLNTKPVPKATTLRYVAAAPKRPKPTQVDCINTLYPATFGSMDSPTGSGKSVSLLVIVDLRLSSDPKRLAIIAVPQTQIADNFTALQYEWEGKLRSLITRKFCGEGTTSVKTLRVDALLNWLRMEHAAYTSERCAVVSHQGLVRLWARLSVEERRELLDNVDLYLDEAHHVDGALSTKDSNCLGAIVKAAVARECFNSIMLVTATMFRGDVTPLLTPEELTKFTRWQLSWEDNFREMKWLRTFDMRYVFGDNWNETVAHVINAVQRKDIVYLPAANSSLSQLAGGKYAGVKHVLETYRLSLGDDATCTYTDEGIYLIRSACGTRRLRILDLVTEQDRVKKKAYFNRMRATTETEPQHGRDMLDVVITLNMMKEGTDWIWAERIVLMGKRDSFVDLLQILGRLLRDAPNKHNVELVQTMLRSIDEQALHTQANLQVNNVLRAMILETILTPTKLVTAGVGRYAGTRHNWLVNVCPAADDRMRLLEETVNWVVTTGFDPSDQNARDKLTKHVSSVVNRLTGKTLNKDMAASLAKTVTRMLVPVNASESKSSLDLIDVVNSTEYLTLVARCGLRTLQDLRTLLRKDSTDNEYVPYVEAQAVVSALSIKSTLEYGRCWSAKKLPGLPRYPKIAYKADWNGWPSFLGYPGALGRSYPKADFDVVLKWQRKYKIANQNKWREYKATGKMPIDFPSNIVHAYGADTLTRHNFFPKRCQARVSKPQDKLKLLKIAIALQTVSPRTRREWVSAYENNFLPPRLPRDPVKFFGDLLPDDFWPGERRHKRADMVSYKTCLRFQHDVWKCKNAHEWQNRYKTFDVVVPSQPASFYSEFNPDEFWVASSTNHANTTVTPKTLVGKSSEAGFQINRYSTRPDSVRPSAA